MPQLVDIERHRLCQQGRCNIEQAAVKIQILKIEQRPVGEAARIIGNDQFAISLLHTLIVADRIFTMTEHHDDGKRRQQKHRGHIERIVRRQIDSRGSDQAAHGESPSRFAQMSRGRSQPSSRLRANADNRDAAGCRSFWRR
jgi:hypothetical protein